VLHEDPVVKRIWRALSARAGRLELSYTDDPDLHLLADGVRVAPESIAERVWSFRLQVLAAELRIVSRSAIPAMIGLEQDQRRLGVALRRIVLHQPGLRLEVGWDEKRLRDGFHNAEPAEQHRWTDGDASLPAEQGWPHTGNPRANTPYYPKTINVRLRDGLLCHPLLLMSVLTPEPRHIGFRLRQIPTATGRRRGFVRGSRVAPE
jgi:hypothetical protein